MSYNFKSIADVEVVAEPTDTANVLIEEDGVIKKAPKTAVGGAGETLVIAFNSNNWVDAYNGYEIISAPDNLYEIAKEMFENLTYVNMVTYDTQSINYGSFYIRHLTEIYQGDNYYRLLFEWLAVDCYQDGQISIWYYD